MQTTISIPDTINESSRQSIEAMGLTFTQGPFNNALVLDEQDEHLPSVLRLLDAVDHRSVRAVTTWTQEELDQASFLRLQARVRQGEPCLSWQEMHKLHQRFPEPFCPRCGSGKIYPPDLGLKKAPKPSALACHYMWIYDDVLFAALPLAELLENRGIASRPVQPCRSSAQTREPQWYQVLIPRSQAVFRYPRVVTGSLNHPPDRHYWERPGFAEQCPACGTLNYENITYGPLPVLDHVPESALFLTREGFSVAGFDTDSAIIVTRDLYRELQALDPRAFVFTPCTLTEPLLPWFVTGGQYPV